MRRCGSLSPSLVAPREPRSRFMKERPPSPFLCRSSSIFVIAAPGTAVNADKLRPDASPHFPRMDIHKATSPHPPSTDGIYELFFHQMVISTLRRRWSPSSFPSRHEQDEHAPVGRWRIDVHACRNEASVSRT